VYEDLSRMRERKRENERGREEWREKFFFAEREMF
jgi:hypothetical protein